MTAGSYRLPLQVLRRLGLTLTACAVISSCAHPDSDADRLEHNRDVVMEFYELAINEKDFAAAEKYMGPRYIQHNPMAKDGKEGLKDFIEYLRGKQPSYHSEIIRSFADGEFVILHVHNKSSPDDPGRAIVDIFRLENGKVVEHWDVIQEIPENPANDNTMF